MLFSEACERNKQPIAQELARWLPRPARVLEVGSGSGQHAVHFSRQLSQLDWQPSERPEALAALQQRIAHEGRNQLAPGSHLADALTLDISTGPWPSGPFEAVFTANTAHIMAASAVPQLVAGAAAVLAPGGLLLLYGPFSDSGRHSAPSNAAFDAHLRSLDPAMGVRDADWITALAAGHGLRARADVALPANNRLLVFSAPDPFGSVAEAYARHRPTYPEAFMDAYVGRLQAAPGQTPLVWDCGCGSGQASLALATRGVRVIATDASAAQLAEASRHPLITYRQASASTSGLDGASVDGVLVAQAVHWFAGEAFNAEACRVCRPGAVLAWIGYLPFQLAGAEPSQLAPLQQHLDHWYREVLAPWWPPQRRWVDQGYAGLSFPGEEWSFPPDLTIERRWSLPDLLGYLGTWSAVQAARQAGHDPLPELSAVLAAPWPRAGAGALTVRWPFMGRWGRVD